MWLDQITDAGLDTLGYLMEKRAKDKLANGGVDLSRYVYGSFHPGRVVMEVAKVASHVFPEGADPYFAKMAGPSPDESMAALSSAHIRSLKDMWKMLNATPTHPRFREIMGSSIPCACPETGSFPMHNPLHALLSFLYAGAQSVPDPIMQNFTGPMMTMFGPRTYGKIRTLVIEHPENQILEASDYEDSDSEGSGLEYDEHPQVHTFIPRMISEILELNNNSKGGLDKLVKPISDKIKECKWVTTPDREFQMMVLKALSDHIGEEGVLKILGKSSKAVVFNTDLDRKEPAILKVHGMLVDEGKLNMPYAAGVTSLSPQVADAIYDKENNKVDVGGLEELISRLETLEVDEEERKEINDRVIGPLKAFFAPADTVVDKIMVTKV